MGSSSLLDIIGSTAVAGLLFLVIFQLNMSTIESRQTYGYNYKNQTNLTTIAMMLEDDFSRIAYNKNPADPLIYPPKNALLVCDSNRFQYRTDVNDDAIPDVVEFSIGNIPDDIGTENPSDFILVKRTWVGGLLSQQNWSLGVTRFKFDYYDEVTSDLILVNPINPLTVGAIRLFIVLESPEKPKQEFLGDTSQYQVQWRQVRVTSKNFGR